MSARGLGQRRGARVICLGLLAAMLVPLIAVVFTSPAHADDDADNYSLYQLASNASSYFGNKNSPDEGSGNGEGLRVDGPWGTVVASPAAGGSLLGYADPEFSFSVSYFFAELSGSSQTLDYKSLASFEDTVDVDYSGLLDYAYFGAANADLGLDSMSSGIVGGMMNTGSGSIIWFLYLATLFVGGVFGLIIKLLQLINPFMWFGAAVSAVNPTFGEGMTQGNDVPAALQPIANFVSSWYGTLNDIAWTVLVPLFLGFLLISLVLFKKMNRGSAIKKFVVRIVFIGVGLPLLGSMYTQVLNKFEDDPVSTSGPTEVVISTFVDFEAWMMNDRLRIPDEANTQTESGVMSAISWQPESGHAFARSTTSVRNTAAWINKQSYPGVYDDIVPGSVTSQASSAYKANATIKDGGSDANAIYTTFGMLHRFIAGSKVSASDFESAIKSTITADKEIDAQTKRDWFVKKKTYGDSKEFGEQDGPKPEDHPVISVAGVKDGSGLTSNTIATSNADHKTARGFRSENLGSGHCRFKVQEGGQPAKCNMSPLAAYNYLNTKFEPNAMTFYSSNKATSGFTRENHMSVSQVGTGPAKFMYWANAATLLGCIALLGFWYAIGMLVASVKRTFSLVAAVPFATLGAVSAIAKVIIYSIALILEVIVTLFLYQFVSQFLISIPNLLVAPVQTLVGDGSVLGATNLAPSITVGLTFISCLLIIGVTFMLLKVRKSILQALDEAVTKLVDKFLETDTTPPGAKGGAGAALSHGVGAGAGMALGNKAMTNMGNKFGGDNSRKSLVSGPTNVGGTNGPNGVLTGPGRPKGLPGGGSGGRGDTEKNAGELVGAGVGGGKDGEVSAAGTSQGGQPSQSTDGAVGHLEVSSADGGAAAARGSQDDKSMAGAVARQGGLSNLGVAGPNGRVRAGTAGDTMGPASTGQVAKGEVVGSRPAGGARVSQQPQARPGQAGVGRNQASAAPTPVRSAPTSQQPVAAQAPPQQAAPVRQAVPRVGASASPRPVSQPPRSGQPQPAVGAAPRVSAPAPNPQRPNPKVDAAKQLNQSKRGDQEVRS